MNDETKEALTKILEYVEATQSYDLGIDSRIRTLREFLKSPSDAAVLCRIREFLYRDPKTNRLDPDRNVSTEDLRAFFLSLMEESGLVPVESPDPDYRTLKCSKCGNARSFEEFALHETRQRVTMFSGGDAPTHGEAWLLDRAPGFPQKVICRECGEVVWSK